MSEQQQEPQSRFYVCPICFNAAGEPVECHGRQMIPCDAERPEDCRPLMARDGRLKTRAPRWFIAALKKLRS